MDVPSSRRVIETSRAVLMEQGPRELWQLLLARLNDWTGARSALAVIPETGEVLAFVGMQADASRTVSLLEPLLAAVTSTTSPSLLANGHGSLALCLPLPRAGARRSASVVLLHCGEELASQLLEQPTELELLLQSVAARLEVFEVRRTLSAESQAKREAEEALRETHSAMIKHQQVGQMCDFRFNTVTGRSTSSPEGYKLFGFPPDLTIIEYEDWASKLYPEDRPRIEAAVARAIEAREPMRFEYRIVRHGEIRHLSCDGQVDSEHAGDLTYYGVLADITERKAVETEFRALQSKLAAANRFASLGELAGSIAHEIRQPLTAITNDAEACLTWLADNPPNLGELTESLSCIVSEASRAANIVTGLRNVARGGSAEVSPLDLNETVEEVLMLARSETQRALVAVTTAYEEQLPLVNGNRTQLQQVVFNLVQNALDALIAVNERPRSLHVSSLSDAEDGSVELRLRDNGVGLQGAAIERIFEIGRASCRDRGWSSAA